MIPSKVRFTGLEFDPENLADRWHRGVIPLDWKHARFMVPSDIQNPVGLVNQWMFRNIEGRWSLWIRYVKGNSREVNVAFEHAHDAMTFVLSDGKNEAFKDAQLKIF